MTRVDIAIIGSGPAGVSAAITAKLRGKSVLLFGSKELSEFFSSLPGYSNPASNTITNF